MKLNAGSKIAQTAAGPVEYALAGEGSPVMVIHGTPGGYDQALGGIDLFIGQGFQVIAPSRPGYLRTPLSSGRDPDAQSELMIALLDSLLIDRAAVIGASGGGPIAVNMALRHPERVACLVLLEALVQPIRLESENMTSGLWASDIMAWLVDTGTRLAPQMILPPEYRQDPRAVGSIQAMASTSFPVSLRREGIINDDAQYANLADLPLDQIQTPVLIVHGDKDTNVPFSQAEYAARTIPGARLVRIAGGTHLTTLFTPQTQAEIRAFLSNCQ